MEEPKSMDECSFFTRRILDGTGTKVTAWVYKGQKVVNIKYECSACGHKGELTQEYKKPITFNCQKCGVEIVVMPLKSKIRGAKNK